MASSPAASLPWMCIACGRRGLRPIALTRTLTRLPLRTSLAVPLAFELPSAVGRWGTAPSLARYCSAPLPGRAMAAVAARATRASAARAKIAIFERRRFEDTGEAFRLSWRLAPPVDRSYDRARRSDHHVGAFYERLH